MVTKTSKLQKGSVQLELVLMQYKVRQKYIIKIVILILLFGLIWSYTCTCLWW